MGSHWRIFEQLGLFYKVALWLLSGEWAGEGQEWKQGVQQAGGRGRCHQRDGRREPSARWGQPCSPGNPGAPPCSILEEEGQLSLALVFSRAHPVISQRHSDSLLLCKAACEESVRKFSLSIGHTALSPEPPSIPFTLWQTLKDLKTKDHFPLLLLHAKQHVVLTQCHHSPFQTPLAHKLLWSLTQRANSCSC